jgi:hypothetical protein
MDSTALLLPVALSISLLAPSGAVACDPGLYADDKERLKDEIRRVDGATAAADGVVVKSGNMRVGSVAIIRPTRVWFGPKQTEYRVVKQNMCHADFFQGERVRVLLHSMKPNDSGLARFFALFYSRVPTFTSPGFSGFAWAMRYPAMRHAVRRKALRLTHVR